MRSWVTKTGGRMELIPVGKKAPEFNLSDKDGNTHSLSSIKSKYIVLYFYPKDNTAGCTLEAQMFNRDLDKFKGIDASVVGISAGDQMSKTKFCEKNGLKFLLLSDTDHEVSKKYGTYGEKSFMRRKFMGISRTTYVLDNDRKIIKVYDKANPITNSGEVLEYLRGIN
jgi:thioredoxin-dependent peroxiredoxin